MCGNSSDDRVYSLILPRLLFSNDWKVDAYLLQTINLKFLVPHQNIQGYIFIIEGCNYSKR